ncbi:NIPA-like protein 2 [Protopterus annectens]|uniref:NIPA-like protein 2 n=1 Tax=Protopterus annectens TaxID=7888 RepID=UPI001CF9BF4F|nr:NIPA-like protein 2 [Protopterus annectens]
MENLSLVARIHSFNHTLEPDEPAEALANSTISDFWGNTVKIHLVGILLAITGNFLISISLNIQKCTHLRLSQRGNPKPYYKSKLWWCGIILMGIGELGNFAAYGFAPATLVAPLGCVAVIASAVISVVFLKEVMRPSDVLGATLATAGTYLLVTFAPRVSQEVTAVKVQKYFVSWQFLIYLILEIIIFCVLLYLYKRKGMKHIVVLLMIVALLASMTVISVKAVSGMITVSVKGNMQLQYPIFYVMLIIMIASCAFQVKFLNQAMELYKATEVVPINFVFFTASAVIAGVIFYQEFHGASLLNIFMFLFGCSLSFLGVFLIARNREEEKPEASYIDFGQIPGKKLLNKIQPDPDNNYGTLQNDENSSNNGLVEHGKAQPS